MDPYLRQELVHELRLRCGDLAPSAREDCLQRLLVWLDEFDRPGIDEIDAAFERLIRHAVGPGSSS